MTVRHFALAFAAIAVVVGFGAGAQNAPDYAAIIAASDRSENDRTIDKRRDPAKLLAFTGVRPGMTVLDMGAGGGYSTELMARAVGPSGKVYGQNPADGSPKARANFEARLQTPAMKNVVALFRPFDDPTPPEVQGLDLISFFFYYHDVTYMEVDRAVMNKKLLSLLKPGGIMVIADHSAAVGAGTTVGKSLHRVEEIALRREVEAAGFKLVGEADFLRQPGDARDFPSTRPTGPVDEFILKFQRPN
jgi:predicted methyltransferase